MSSSTASSPAGPAASRKNWSDWVPGLAVLRGYHLAWLRNDIVAGIVLSAMLVPVGMAYAVASGVPAIYGLYATIVPLLVYALFGPSRILVLGPDSSLAPTYSVSCSPCRPATRHAPSSLPAGWQSYPDWSASSPASSASAS